LSRILAPRWEKDRVEAVIEIGRRRYPIWFELPDIKSGPFTPTAFLLLALMPAMRCGESLEVEGLVEQQVMQQLPQLMDLYQSWDRRFKPIRVSCQGVFASSAPSQPCQWAAFSGGVDSFLTVEQNRPQLERLLFVQGLDLPLENHSLRGRVMPPLYQAAREWGLPLYEVSSNLRALTDRYCPWHLVFGGALACLGWLLATQVSRLHLAGCAPDSEGWPDGSHPLQNRLMSGPAFEMVCGGGEASRFERVESLCHSSIFQRFVRVCWENLGDRYNCCCCEKCLRTMVSLEILGTLGQTPAFPEPLKLSRLPWVVTDSESLDTYYFQENLAAAQRLGASSELQQALMKALSPTARVGRRWTRRLFPPWLRRWLFRRGLWP